MSSVAIATAETSQHAPLPRALPAWVYNNAELHRLEVERVLLPSWQIVCHVNSIPKAGDYVTFDLGSESVVVLRDRDGTLRGYHNVCRHRGARLLDAAGNCPGPITCPYHGWSYRQDGSLVGVPMRDTFPGIDRSEFSLKPVRIDTAFGFVFVAMRGDPPPVSKVWGVLAEELAAYRTEEMVPLGPDLDRHLERRLEDRDRQLPRVLSRADRPSGPQSDVHARLRGSNGRRDRSARRELAARAGILGVVGAHVPAPRRKNCDAFAGKAAPQLAVLQRTAQSRHRRVSRSDGFLPGIAGRARQMPGAQRLVRLARCPAADSRAALPQQPDQHPGQQRRPLALRARAAGARLEQLPARSALETRALDVRISRDAARIAFRK